MFRKRFPRLPGPEISIQRALLLFRSGDFRAYNPPSPGPNIPFCPLLRHSAEVSALSSPGYSGLSIPFHEFSYAFRRLYSGRNCRSRHQSFQGSFSNPLEAFDPFLPALRFLIIFALFFRGRPHYGVISHNYLPDLRVDFLDVFRPNARATLSRSCACPRICFTASPNRDESFFKSIKLRIVLESSSRRHLPSTFRPA